MCIVGKGVENQGQPRGPPELNPGGSCSQALAARSAWGALGFLLHPQIQLLPEPLLDGHRPQADSALSYSPPGGARG